MNKQNTKNNLPARENADVASGILEGIMEAHPQTAEGIVNLHDVKACLEEVKAITADTAAEIESAINDADNLAALVFLLAQAHYDQDGAPDPKLTGQALESVGSSIQAISRKLDLVMDHIYKKGEK